MPASPTILVVDDDPHVRTGLCDILNHHDYATCEAGDGRTALSKSGDADIDLMLLDLDLPRLSGMEVLKETMGEHPTLPVIIVSGKGTIQAAVQATKTGAYDFLEKPVDAQRALVTVRNALERADLQRQRDRLIKEAQEQYQMVGSSEPMQQLYDIIDKAATTPSKVFITGENGTGKELVARAIHHNSDRAGNPFVAVNCAALPESLIESELFGHSKGAFTGAHSQRKGAFQQADGGTLFLDEIGEMRLATQSKMLRVLEEQTVQPVGSDGTVDVNARVIAATNRDPHASIEAGTLRRDLYYRLNVIGIHVPALRERRSDIPDLVAHFLHHFSERNGVTPRELESAGLSILMGHDWPGNVRQLRNVIERLVALSNEVKIPAAAVQEALDSSATNPEIIEGNDLRSARAEFEKAFIRQALQAHDGTIQATADALGISRSHLWKKMKKYDLEAPE